MVSSWPDLRMTTQDQAVAPAQYLPEKDGEAYHTSTLSAAFASVWWRPLLFRLLIRSKRACYTSSIISSSDMDRL